MTIQNAPVRILLLNPNCSEAMTSAMAASAAKLPISAVFTSNAPDIDLPTC